jgi:hypothetical protein
MVGRLAQMIIELRDEYVRDPRPDTLDQVERRLDELGEIREQLRERLHPKEPTELEQPS